eukprot:5050865-Prymnesium_polylepis.1
MRGAGVRRGSLLRFGARRQEHLADGAPVAAVDALAQNELLMLLPRPLAEAAACGGGGGGARALISALV